MPGFRRHALTFALALITGGIAADASFARSERFASPSGRDPVTGWVCTTPVCDMVRMPKSRCICRVENPMEQDRRKLRMSCYTTEGLKWVACPVGPR